VILTVSRHRPWRQVAAKLGVSAERVRQIEQAALERLNAAAFAS
jgi:DNA-directed RNA polymerase sigma subunit (sigma70/sigma32)